MARIISGVAKNTKLDVPRRGTRPMTDRAKSALFSILYDWVEDATVLDLFAGSGSLGIEALSRGAKFAVFVDNSEEAIECIETNLDKASLYEYAEVIEDTAENFVQKCNRKFDLVFLDPPYKDTEEEHLLISENCVKDNGLIVVKHSPRFELKERVGELELVDTRAYGKNVISFYRKTS